MDLLKGKVAIVTGSSDGIGAEIALEFVRSGAMVTLHGRRTEKLEAVAQKCQALAKDKKKPLIVVGDICIDDVRVKLINETVAYYGKLDVVVSNAGHYHAVLLTANCDLKMFDAMIDVHTRAPYHLLKLSAQHLIKSKGNFINISSVGGSMTVLIGGAEYGAAKAASDHIMKFAALELGPQGVRVNTISPGCIKTDIMANSAATRPTNDPALIEVDMMSPFYTEGIPLKRIGQVEEIAHVAAFLASDKASYITGAKLIVDGGLINTGAYCRSQNPQ